MPRTLLGLVLTAAVIVTLAVGAPYAGLFLDRATGPWNTTAIEHDGSVTHMSFGRDLPRPEWIFLPPGASIVQATQVTNEAQGRDVGMLELASRLPLAEIKRFYRERLSRADFAVVDLGIGPMNAATAEYLGVGAILVASRAKSGDRLDISIGTPEGLLRTSLIRLSWRKVPRGTSPPDRPMPHGAQTQPMQPTQPKPTLPAPVL
jgi:hypothetical protein